MKTSFQKTLIAASVGVAMFAAVSTASANSLLFPYFTTASGAQSALSISSNSNAGAPESLHYVYNYGDACTHYDGKGKVTANDLMQHSITAPAAGGYGKAAGTDGSTPFYFPLANTFGFLVVSNTSSANGTTVPSTFAAPADVISGDMAIVDPTTGLVVSYAGISNSLSTNATAPAVSANEGDFSFIQDNNFNLSTYGAGLVDTSWYAVVVGNMQPAILANSNWTGSSTVTNNGLVYDNDEQAFSGVKTKALTCAGKFATTDLMTTAQQAAVGPNGGLIHATNAPTIIPANAAANPPTAAIPTSTGLVLNKMQVVKAAVGAPFAGKMFLHREAKAF